MATEKARVMRSPLVWIAPLVLAGGVIAGTGWWLGAGNRAPLARAAGAVDVAPLEASGTVEGTLGRVASKLQGKVAEVRVREGDRVRQGQVLVRLEGRDINALVAAARSRLAAASARLEEARAGTRSEQIRQAEAELRRALAARAGAADAARNLEDQWRRSTELKEQLEAAESRGNASAASLEAAAARLERLRAGARPDELREAEEAVAAEAARAQRAAEEEERLRGTYEQGAIARSTWHEARTERDVAAANLARAAPLPHDAGGAPPLRLRALVRSAPPADGRPGSGRERRQPAPRRAVRRLGPLRPRRLRAE